MSKGVGVARHNTSCEDLYGNSINRLKLLSHDESSLILNGLNICCLIAVGDTVSSNSDESHFAEFACQKIP